MAYAQASRYRKAPNSCENPLPEPEEEPVADG